MRGLMPRPDPRLAVSYFIPTTLTFRSSRAGYSARVDYLAALANIFLYCRQLCVERKVEHIEDFTSPLIAPPLFHVL